MNNQNLRRPEDLTPIERRQLASKAGKASGEARKRKKKQKELLEMLYSLKITDETEKAKLSELGILEEDQTLEMLPLLGIFTQATEGNIQAFLALQQTLGEDIRSKELQEKTRNNKAQEKLKEKELEIKEKQITSMESAVSSIPQTTVAFVKTLMANGGEGLGEDD